MAFWGCKYMKTILLIEDNVDNARIAITGGSDAHDPTHFYTAWTEFEDTVETPADFIRALKSGNVKPDYDREFYKLNVVLE